MPENNFIYNDRYLLSNLTSQKLYAQSPLTTGVSGTSAYIGIEPSAQYNETVLWDGNNQTATMLLNDNVNNYESIKFFYGYSGSNDTNTQIVETTYDSNSSGCKLVYYTTDDDPSFKIRTTTISLSGTSAIPRLESICRLTISMPNGSIACSVSTAQGPVIYKILGINNKQTN